MLSDEEREALQYFNTETKTEAMHYGAVLVKLIEKQSKEIEHQKEKRENQKKELAILNAKQIEFNKLVNTVNSYKGQFKRQQKEIEELKEKNNKLMEELDLTTVYISGVYDGEKKVEGKIKAKIEEEKECGSVDGTNEMIIEVLQSLLKKE